MHECTGWQSIQTRSPCTHAYMHSITSCGRIIQQPYPYISSSKFSANWCPTCYLCRDGCWIMRPHYVIMWSTYLHVCMDFLFVYLSASTFMHWAIPTCGGFLFRNLLWRLVSVLENLFYAVPPTHLQLMRHLCTCAFILTNASNSQYLSLPRKKAQAVKSRYAQSKAQKAHPQIILWPLVAVSNATCIALRC